MSAKDLSFEDVVKFHGHACPGLAFGYRVSQCALQQLVVDRSGDEDLVAILAVAENDLLKVTRPEVAMPEPARIFATIRCVKCGEKVMEPRTTVPGDGPVCIPCGVPVDSRKP